MIASSIEHIQNILGDKLEIKYFKGKTYTFEDIEFKVHSVSKDINTIYIDLEIKKGFYYYTNFKIYWEIIEHSLDLNAVVSLLNNKFSTKFRYLCFCKIIWNIRINEKSIPVIWYFSP